MKTLFISHYSSMYGANRSMFNLLCDLKTRYHIDILVLANCRGDLTEELEKRGIECVIHKFYCLGYQPSERAKKYRLLAKLKGKAKCVKQLKIQHEVLELLKNRGIDLIHSNSSVIGIGAYLARQLKVPHVWHIREANDKGPYTIDYLYSRRYLNALYNNADAVIAISKNVEHDVLQAYPKAKVTMIYNGLEMVYKQCKSFSIQDPVRFCCVGFLNEGKGQAKIIRACGQLQKRGVPFELNLIGADLSGDYEQKLKDLVSQLGITEKVKFWGFRSDAVALLAQMDVGIMASNWEAFGRVTVEYMNASMPVIAAAVSATLEIVEDGKNGLLYPCEDVTALADCMQKLSCDHALIKQMGTYAFESSKRFTMERNTDEVFKLYRRVLPE